MRNRPPRPLSLRATTTPVTAEQVREKLQSDGWSDVVVSRNGRYIEATGSLNGQSGKIAVDSQTVAFEPPMATMMVIEHDGGPA